MEFATDFWNRVNSLIKSNNTTQQSLSEQCGFNPRRVQNLSSGNRLPDIQEGYLIASSLHTSVEYLVTGKHTDAESELIELKRKILELLKPIQ